MEEKSLKKSLLTIKDVCHLLNISRRTAYYWIKKGILQPIRIGKVFRFHPEDLQSLLDQNRIGLRPPKKRILAIDDDLLVRESLKMILEKNGFEAAVVSGCDEALELLSKEGFDLVITDIRMPQKNGIECLESIREMRSRLGKAQLPEIILTAYDEAQAKEAADRMGVREFILKPFDLNNFISTLHRNLN